MTYPGTIDTFTPIVDDPGGDEAVAAQVNVIYTAVTAIETELGTDPAGSATDVKTRLLRSMDVNGNIAFSAQTALTISSGAVTIARNYHTIDTEGSASSDNLDTLNGYSAGFLVFLRAASSARSVIIRHNVGNIYTVTGDNITLDDEYNMAIGIYDPNLSKWILGTLGSNFAPSASVSPSSSASASVSPSSSASRSPSPSASVSPSSSASPSVSPSSSASPS